VVSVVFLLSCTGPAVCCYTGRAHGRPCGPDLRERGCAEGGSHHCYPIQRRPPAIWPTRQPRGTWLIVSRVVVVLYGARQVSGQSLRCRQHSAGCCLDSYDINGVLAPLDRELVLSMNTSCLACWVLARCTACSISKLQHYSHRCAYERPSFCKACVVCTCYACVCPHEPVSGILRSLCEASFCICFCVQVSVLDYQSTQLKLLPLLATAYCLHFTKDHLVRRWGCRIASSACGSLSDTA
jgi:hypothetical protein